MSVNVEAGEIIQVRVMQHMQPTLIQFPDLSNTCEHLSAPEKKWNLQLLSGIVPLSMFSTFSTSSKSVHLVLESFFPGSPLTPLAGVPFFILIGSHLCLLLLHITWLNLISGKPLEKNCLYILFIKPTRDFPSPNHLDHS